MRPTIRGHHAAKAPGGVHAITEEGTSYIPEAWSPDGTRLLYAAAGNGMAVLWMLTAKDGKAERFDTVASPWSNSSGTLPTAIFSPDGKWVAYSSREGAYTRSGLYVQPFPPTGVKYQISRSEDVAQHPVWSPDMKELFFTPGPGPGLRVVSISMQPAFSFGDAALLPRPFVTTPPWFERAYDISRDGRRFLGLVVGAAGKSDEAPQMRIVQNWTEELEAKVSTK